MRVAKLCIPLFVLTVGCSQPPRALDMGRFRDHLEVWEPHVHLGLLSPSGPLLPDRAELEQYIDEVKDEWFLNSAGAPSENPVAPCALLAAGTISYHLNLIWRRVEMEGVFTIPPKGTFILGMYDEDIRDGKVPTADLGQAAEIIARLFVWHSWGADAPANTLIHDLTQKQCLELFLSGTDRMLSAMESAYNDPVFSHSAAVGRYSLTMPTSEFLGLLEPLRKEGFSKLSSSYPGNPVTPCSLLRALNRASRLNRLTGEILAGTLQEKKHPTLAKYFNDLRGGTIPREDLPRAAEIVANLFVAQILWEDKVRNFMFAETEATQEECVEEVLHPLSMRERLLQKHGRDQD